MSGAPQGFLGEAVGRSLKRARILGEVLAGCEPPRERPGRLRRALLQQIDLHGGAVIVEYKRCSPSSGFIAYVDPHDYMIKTRGAAAAYSVLTEPHWFCGSMELIPVFAQEAPVLMKDFVVSEEQVKAAACMGAAGVLLIWDALPARRIEQLARYAVNLGLDPVIEVKDARSALQAAGLVPEAIIGVNSRDLATLRVDFARMLEEVRRFRQRYSGGDHIVVAESGVDTPEKALTAFRSGADAVLVGTAAMKDPGLPSAIIELAREMLARRG